MRRSKAEVMGGCPGTLLRVRGRGGQHAAAAAATEQLENSRKLRRPPADKKTGNTAAGPCAVPAALGPRIQPLGCR